MIKDDESLKFKQKYLREEIIENGYNPEKFYKYISSQVGEKEINLENWSLEKLKEVVNNFKNDPTTTIDINNINNNSFYNLYLPNENNEGNEKIIMKKQKKKTQKKMIPNKKKI